MFIISPFSVIGFCSMKSFEDCLLVKHQIKLITQRQFKVQDAQNNSKDKEHSRILLGTCVDQLVLAVSGNKTGSQTNNGEEHR